MIQPKGGDQREGQEERRQGKGRRKEDAVLVPTSFGREPAPKDVITVRIRIREVRNRPLTAEKFVLQELQKAHVPVVACKYNQVTGTYALVLQRGVLKESRDYLYDEAVYQWHP